MWCTRQPTARIRKKRHYMSQSFAWMGCLNSAHRTLSSSSSPTTCSPGRRPVPCQQQSHNARQWQYPSGDCPTGLSLIQTDPNDPNDLAIQTIRTIQTIQTMQTMQTMQTICFWCAPVPLCLSSFHLLLMPAGSSSGPLKISFFFAFSPPISFFLLSLEVSSWKCGRGHTK